MEEFQNLPIHRAALAQVIRGQGAIGQQGLAHQGILFTGITMTLG
jgi:hypothetical protein